MNPGERAYVRVQIIGPAAAPRPGEGPLLRVAVLGRKSVRDAACAEVYVAPGELIAPREVVARVREQIQAEGQKR